MIGPQRSDIQDARGVLRKVEVSEFPPAAIYPEVAVSSLSGGGRHDTHPECDWQLEVAQLGEGEVLRIVPYVHIEGSVVYGR
jgi:hypothetical protein